MDNNDWQITEALFNQALDLPHSQRFEFLSKECGENTSLLNSVLSLLEHVNNTGEIKDAVDQVAFDLINQQPKLDGQVLGPYRIISELGQGGMGSVYLAERNDDEFNKQVAIKLIRSPQASESVMQRFRNERQILADLEHPYIARLLDGGTTKNGLPYLVMEYIEGEPIDEYCNRKQLNIKQRLRLFNKVCSAVTYAHQKLVVHRDLKPSNLLVTENGEPRLLDFGIAKLLDDSDKKKQAVETAVDERMLTPLYSSPEQIRGDSVSTVTDVFALGVVLYELLTGSRPYGKGETGRFQIEESILNSDPLIPSRQFTLNKPNQTDFSLTGKQLNRELSGDIDTIIMTALRKEPQNRYQSVAQFNLDIEKHLNYLPITARPPSLRYLIGKFLRRNRFSSALAASLILALVGGSTAIAIQSEKMRVERDRAQAVTEFITNMFNDIKPDKAQGKEVTVREVLDKSSDKLQQKDHLLTSQPQIEANIRRVIGDIYLDLGLLPAAEAHLKSALAIHRNVIKKPSLELLATVSGLSGVYHIQRIQDKRLPLLQEALTLSRALWGEKAPMTFGMMGNLASYYNMQGQQDKALALELSLYELRRESLGDKHVDIIYSLTSIGVVYHWMGRYSESENYYRRCLTLAKELLGNKHPKTLYCLAILGSVLESSGNYASAEPIIKEHIRLSRLVNGKEHPVTLRSMHNLADTFRGLKRYPESETLFLEALAKRRKVLGNSHLETLQSQMKLARLYRLQNRFEDALPLVTDTVDKKSQALGFAHPTTLIAAQILADLYFSSGELGKAEALADNVLEERIKANGNNFSLLIHTLAGQARIYLAQQKFENAEKSLEATLPILAQNPDFKSENLTAALQEFKQFSADNSSDERFKSLLLQFKKK